MSLREAQATYEAEKSAAKAKLTAAIQEARKTRSLAEIAEELGITRQRVSQLSQGR